jgi:16S rRNA processing protein RimM
MSERVVVGIVRRTRGVHGELVIESRSDLPDRFEALKELYLVTRRATRRVTVQSVRQLKGDEVWLTLAEITDREEAKTLRGATLEIDLALRPELPDGVYYYDQLEGLDVYDTSDRLLGRLTAVFPRGGQDLYGVHTEHGEVLVPATAAIVKKVDLPMHRIVIDPPPGLMVPEDAH